MLYRCLFLHLSGEVSFVAEAKYYKLCCEFDCLKHLCRRPVAYSDSRVECRNTNTKRHISVNYACHSMMHITYQPFVLPTVHDAELHCTSIIINNNNSQTISNAP